MRDKMGLMETYVIHPGQSINDLPSHVRDVLLPNSRVESVVTTYADTQSIFRFRIVEQKVETYGR